MMYSGDLIKEISLEDAVVLNNLMLEKGYSLDGFVFKNTEENLNKYLSEFTPSQILGLMINTSFDPVDSKYVILFKNGRFPTVKGIDSVSDLNLEVLNINEFLYNDKNRELLPKGIKDLL